MSYSLTELQLAIMTVLWERGEAGVIDIHDALRGQRRLAQSTVATLLVRLEDKGVVEHRVEGRQYIYRAAVSADQVKRSVVQEFAELSRGLFPSDLAGLVQHLISSRDVDPDDLARVRELIEEKERTLRKKKRTK